MQYKKALRAPKQEQRLPRGVNRVHWAEHLPAHEHDHSRRNIHALLCTSQAGGNGGVREKKAVV